MIRIGVIGYGYWGPNLVRNFHEVGGCQVVAVSDTRAERRALVEARYPSVKATSDERSSAIPTSTGFRSPDRRWSAQALAKPR